MSHKDAKYAKQVSNYCYNFMNKQLSYGPVRTYSVVNLKCYSMKDNKDLEDLLQTQLFNFQKI